MKAMQMSDALLLGAAMHPKYTGGYALRTYAPDNKCKITHTCALGAVAVASGVNLFDPCVSITEQINNRYPITQANVEFPDNPLIPELRMYVTNGKVPVGTAVVILNDTCGWSRENIAIWLAQVERDNPEFMVPDIPTEEAMEFLSNSLALQQEGEPHVPQNSVGQPPRTHELATCGA